MGGVAMRAHGLEEDDGSCKVYRGPVLSHRRRVVPICRSFTEIPAGSNSIETELSVVNCRIESRFLRIAEATGTLLRRKGPGMVEKPMPTTGRIAPLQTMMEVGEEGNEEGVTIPGLEAI
jgi:hypothetical protein